MQKLQLFIPEPCHENWQQMTPTDQGRFCNSCAKEVVDFSMMTDTEVLNYFTTLTHEKVCGRTLPGQLDRTISYPKEPKKRLFWYWNYIVMFFMFFAKTKIAKAQGNVKVKTECSPLSTNDIRRDMRTPGVTVARSTTTAKAGTDSRIRLGGVSAVSLDKKPLYVVDGELWINESIDAIHPDDIDDLSVIQATEATALFGPKGVNGAIVITTRKFKTKNLDTVIVSSYGITKGQMVSKTTTTTEYNTVLGGLYIGVNVRTGIADTLNMIATKVTGAIKIYPNPVQRGNSFNLALKIKQPSSYRIQISDASGRIVLQKQINAVAKEFTERITADKRWSNGIYYLSLIDNKNKLIHKISFIVQE